jgi:hypothetical protein
VIISPSRCLVSSDHSRTMTEEEVIALAYRKLTLFSSSNTDVCRNVGQPLWYLTLRDLIHSLLKLCSGEVLDESTVLIILGCVISHMTY